MAEYDDLPYIVVERRSAGVTPFLWGAVLGTGLALLFAPRSGNETRREIRNGLQRLRDAAEGTVRQLQETVTGTLEDIRGQVTGRMEEAHRAMEEGRAAARQTRSDLERRIRETQAGPERPSEEDEFQA